ncbi:thioredoxin [Luteimonas aestuarii]|uniref:Thioredoxin n=1 Tax=Luteimonas aestuarii TaxID=453837 RepID=A0A4V3AM88_9GAMM|nr:thioredoxin family protein [Luteimonas aestuarii]TDK25992.1 thioredoxin [Luteimonas aestuarii]
MGYERDYAVREPTRSDVDDMPGRVLVEFGAPWCPHCIAAQPALQVLLANHDEVAHIKVEDGGGRPLGRSFGVKLWPTLVLLESGEERARVVRPRGDGDLVPLREALKPDR